MNNANRFDKIMAHLADAASTAVDGMNEAVHSAGQVVSGKYDKFKMNMELARLQSEQQKLFCSIGAAVYAQKHGSQTEERSVDELVEDAFALETSINTLREQIAQLAGEKICPNCGRRCPEADEYCASCGTKLPDAPPPCCACDATEEEAEENTEDADADKSDSKSKK